MKARMFSGFALVLTLLIILGGAAGAQGPQPPSGVGMPAVTALSAGCVAGGGYNPACDVDHDDDVDIVDIQLVVSHWSETGTWMSDSWLLAGNAGINPATHFLGTTDNVALEVRVNNQRALRIEPGAFGGPNLIGGFRDNGVGGWWVTGATIAGGGNDSLCEGPCVNRVTGSLGTVGGGGGNTAGHGATVGGGGRNTASGPGSTVSGGGDPDQGGNTASDQFSTVGGGIGNTASGAASTVGGGSNNTASGDSSTVPGGWLNTAAGEYSFAAGLQAKANHQGAFVWADSTAADFASTGNNQFLLRASGGVGIGTNTPTSMLTVAGLIESKSGGFKFPDGTIQTTAAVTAQQITALEARMAALQQQNATLEARLTALEEAMGTGAASVRPVGAVLPGSWLLLGGLLLSSLVLGPRFRSGGR